MGGNKESKGMPGKDWKTESAAVELLFGWFDGWLVVARGLLLLVCDCEWIGCCQHDLYSWVGSFVGRESIFFALVIRRVAWSEYLLRSFPRTRSLPRNVQSCNIQMETVCDVPFRSPR